MNFVFQSTKFKEISEFSKIELKFAENCLTTVLINFVLF